MLSQKMNAEDCAVATCACTVHATIDFGRQFGIEGDHLKSAEMAGLMHAGGKLAVPDEVPNTAGWLTDWKNRHFDETVFQAFVKTLGIYPVGTLVRL